MFKLSSYKVKHGYKTFLVKFPKKLHCSGLKVYYKHMEVKLRIVINIINYKIVIVLKWLHGFNHKITYIWKAFLLFINYN